MIEPKFREQVKKFVEENRQNVVNDIKEIVGVKSVGLPAEGDMPFGRDVKNALDKGLELAGRMGLKTVNVDNYIGYAQLDREGDDDLATICHLGVVREGNG